ncbi:MAG: adenylyltransferase/cytidyltransferase family protein [Clostridiales Family XIII bacterium]|jgi:glycerol-3-phosphate cytidylyltransferase|nr:adenylyltransferase/cytidyltransferase family protein [Clostridiales Family XIII bacterium]
MKKVITYGTYDLFHEGHLRLLERARGLGDYLIVGVTSDNFDRERGKLNVKDSLAARIEAVRATGFADEIIVEEYLGQKLSDVIRFGVSVFAIGSDWKGKFDYLSKHCEVVYLERTKGISSTGLREEGAKLLRLGIVSDSQDDGDVGAETDFVSGLEISGVYVPAISGGLAGLGKGDMAAAGAFCAKYDLAAAFGTADELFAGSDVVYIHTRRRHRFFFAAAALRHGCHVICDFPLNKPEEAAGICGLVKEKGLVFADCVPLAYLRTFQQLIWLLQGGAIGQVLSVECAMPTHGSFRDAEALAAFAVTRILGTENAGVRRLCVCTRERYDRVVFSYPDAVASCSASGSKWLKPGMTVLGSDGRVNVPGAWWNMSYFKMRTGSEDDLRRYSFNIEGPGLRYLLSEVTQMIAERRGESIALSHEEAQKLVYLLEQGDLL